MSLSTHKPFIKNGDAFDISLYQRCPESDSAQYGYLQIVIAFAGKEFLLYVPNDNLGSILEGVPFLTGTPDLRPTEVYENGALPLTDQRVHKAMCWYNKQLLVTDLDPSGIPSIQLADRCVQHREELVDDDATEEGASTEDA